MKKFISILLAVIIAFSAVTVGVSAYTLGEGESAWIGYDGGDDGSFVYTDPGKETPIPVSIAANLDTDDLKDIDVAKATVSFSFSFETDANSPIVKVEPAAGVTFEQTETDKKDTFIDGKVTIPASAFKGTDSIVFINITVKMADDWKVEDYKALNPVLVKLSEKYLQSGVAVSDGTTTKYIKPVIGDVTIKATPYKPNFIERAIEWIKNKLKMIPVLFQTLNNFLLTELEAPDWVVQKENRAKRDAEAAAAEAEANQQSVIVA